MRATCLWFSCSSDSSSGFLREYLLTIVMGYVCMTWTLDGKLTESWLGLEGSFFLLGTGIISTGWVCWRYIYLESGGDLMNEI